MHSEVAPYNITKMTEGLEHVEQEMEVTPSNEDGTLVTTVQGPVNESQNALKKVTSTTDNTSGTVIISVIQIVYVPLPYYPYEL